MLKSEAQKLHCISFFHIAVLTSLNKGKRDYHEICSESEFMKQEVDRQKNLVTCLYRLVKC